MQPPSAQLLRVLRSVELLQSSLRGVQRRPQLGHGKIRACALACQSKSPPWVSQSCQLSGNTSNHSVKTSTSDRGPTSQEDTQTDFGSMNVLGNMPTPATSIDACLSDGFHLDNGLKIGGGSGCLLVAGEAFSWRPWEAFGKGAEEGKRKMFNERGQWDVQKDVWGVLDLVWPKPGTPSTFVVSLTVPIIVFRRRSLVGYHRTHKYNRSPHTRIGSFDMSHLPADQKVHQFVRYQS